MGDVREQGITLGELKQELKKRAEPSDKTFTTPLISANTIDGLLKEYDAACEDPDITETPYTLLIASSMRYMSFIKFSEGGTTYRSLGRLYRFFFEQYVKGANSANIQEEVATVGAGFIFSAFHREEGPELIDRMRAIPTSQANGIIASSLDGHRLIDRQTIYQRGASNLTIPSDQPHLKHGIEEIKILIKDQYHMALEDGAISAFNSLNQMRPFFKPKEQKDLNELLSPAQPRLLL